MSADGDENLLNTFHQAEILAEAKKYREAESLYSDFIQQSLRPNNSTLINHKIWLVKLAQAYNNRGHARYMQVEFDSAVDDYTNAIMHYPFLAIAHYNRGTVHFRLGNFKLALEDFESAVNLRPQMTEFQQALQDTIQQNPISTDDFNREDEVTPKKCKFF